MAQKTKIIFKELDEWENEGFITSAQKEIIKTSYSSEKSTRKLFLIFALLGTLFIGAGILSLFAYNWNTFTQKIKVIISVTPLIICQGLLFYAVSQNKSKVWIESLCVGTAFALINSMALISQTYQLTGSALNLIFWWLLLIVPLIYLLKSNYLGFGFLILTCFIGLTYGYRETPIPIIYLGTAMIPYYLYSMYQPIAEKSLLSVAFISWLISVIFKLDFGVTWILIMLILLSLVFIYGRFTSVYETFGILFILGITFFYCFYIHDITHIYHVTIISISLPLILVSWIFYQLPKIKKRDLIYLLSLILLFFDWLANWSTVSFLPQISLLFFNLYLIGLCIYLIVIGVNTRIYWQPRLAIIVLNLFIFFKVLGTNIGLIPKGISFILVGILLLGSNYYLSRKRSISRND